MYIRAVSVRPILVVGYRMELYISKLHCIVDQSVIQSPEVAVTCTHVVVTANADCLAFSLCTVRLPIAVAADARPLLHTY